MSRKTNIASLSAIAATLTVTIASAVSSGAFAQQGEIHEISNQSLTEETVPVFVAEEVVQPITEQVADDIAADAKANAVPQAASLNALVSSVTTPASLSSEMECLAGAIYFESRGEPVAGQLAVAQVIVNRAESGQFPESYCGVVFQRSQFSFVKGGAMPSIKRGSSAWKRAKAVARIAHEGLWDSQAADSLYFHAKYVRPSWSRKKVARATINTHIFYR
ncbi:cell wall hydrolase [Altererythrobacter confluentis]|uniref:Cell wall hydrolase n=1 Tax=Allopontixanthobacter confluentis TaxID=1849021 RepID=A0A6L7GI52_9SPHN|nr:cell wall hydrolase [Allopontixanthobacter confluentis]MXP15235.1 cell wall hydrolase [Allopontixanthobacter confluentis]